MRNLISAVCVALPLAFAANAVAQNAPTPPTQKEAGKGAPPAPPVDAKTMDCIKAAEKNTDAAAKKKAMDACRQPAPAGGAGATPPAPPKK